MLINCSLLAILPILCSWVVSCSEYSFTIEDYKVIELTESSISRIAARLVGDPDDSLVIALQTHLATSTFHQRLCIAYLIGSVAIFGEVDGHALGTICRICKGQSIICLSELLGRLAIRNDLDTMAQFIAERIGQGKPGAPFEYLIVQLVKDNWNAMEKLAMKTLAILKDDPTQSHGLYFLLRCLPFEQQYEAIGTGTVSLDTMCAAHHGVEKGPAMRSIFFLARCSHRPNPQLRQQMADKFPHFKQLLADSSVNSAVIPCPDSILVLGDDWWYRIFTFVDVETLIFVLSSVCLSWRNLHPAVLVNDTRIHDVYVQDFDHVIISKIHTIMPWKNFLSNGKETFRYLGRCIAGGALDRNPTTPSLQYGANQYIESVVHDVILPPKIRGCATLYDAFLKQYGAVYRFCAIRRPILGKPAFLTDEEFEKAIHHFVHKDGLMPQLSERFLADHMPEVFHAIGENEELMAELVRLSFRNFVGASIALVLHGQAREIPKKLTRLILSQTGMFRGLVDPKPVPFHRHYSFIAESGVLPEIIIGGSIAERLHQFLISFVLSIRHEPDKIDQVAASIISRFSRLDKPTLERIKWWLEYRPFEALMESQGYSVDEINFFIGFMMRCKLLSKPGA